jgi:hypothetical protein
VKCIDEVGYKGPELSESQRSERKLNAKFVAREKLVIEKVLRYRIGKKMNKRISNLIEMEVVHTRSFDGKQLSRLLTEDPEKRTERLTTGGNNELDQSKMKGLITLTDRVFRS